MTSSHEPLKARRARYGFENLLVWLFFYLLVGPFLNAVPYAGTVMAVLLTVVLFSAVCTLNRRGRLFPVSVVLLSLTLLLLWLTRLGVLDLPTDITSALLIVYLSVLVCPLVRHLFTVRRVTANVICAALCLYLILGFLWGAVFSLTESLAPGSFSGGLLSDGASPEETSHYLRYFSFITLSTLGYGDITPQTLGAAALCQAEAVLGQFFALVLVARLVGMQVAQETTGDT